MMKGLLTSGPGFMLTVTRGKRVEAEKPVPHVERRKGRRGL
jgi:hypothetical protein